MSAARQFFGTDGVRGPYGGPVINEAFFARLACAAGAWVRKQISTNFTRCVNETRSSDALQTTGRGKVLIGCDTRLSGEALTRAAVAGLRVAGMEPVDLGVLPTPAIALAVRDSGAALGVVITASHNPAGDNGIKFFKRGGLKLSDEEEAAIEALLPDALPFEKDAEDTGESRRLMCKGMIAAVEEYSTTVQQMMTVGALRGWHLVLDTANGATLATSLNVLRRLEAQVVHIGSGDLAYFRRLASFPPEVRKAMQDNTGKIPAEFQINDGCGSEHPEKMCAAVRAHGARLGIAHDGDGDRCVLCDEHGDVLDGDEILTLLALHALREGRLGADTLVVTVQSNLGVDAALAAAGGRVVRTPVGDRHVAEKMRELGATLGGESSGHIICTDVSPTGDGLVAALRVMEVMRATDRPLSELRRWLRKFPQASTTVEIAPGAAKPPLESLPLLAAAIRTLEAELGTRGRVLARWSGTEPKLRLLVEGPDEAAVRAGLAQLVTAARADLGAGAA